MIERDVSNPATVHPQALQIRDCVALVSPASWFDPQRAEAGMNTLRQLGYLPRMEKHALARYGQYSAGTAQQRLDDLYTAFSDTSVRAIICNRRGCGSAELLSKIDLERILTEQTFHPDRIVHALRASGHAALQLPSVNAIDEHLGQQLRCGDVAAILSNGGFDDIYQKRPERLRLLHADKLDASTVP